MGRVDPRSRVAGARLVDTENEVLVLEEEHELGQLLVAERVDCVRISTPMHDKNVFTQLAGGRHKARPVQPTSLSTNGSLPFGEGGRDVAGF
eukprot:601597-Alexandrium_andersonii.AAC.1